MVGEGIPAAAIVLVSEDWKNVRGKERGASEEKESAEDDKVKAGECMVG